MQKRQRHVFVGKVPLNKTSTEKNEKIKTIPREKSHVSIFTKIANSRILEGSSSKTANQTIISHYNEQRCSQY